MEDKNHRNDDGMPPRPVPNPDDPLPSIESNDPGSMQNLEAPMPLARERRPQRGGLIGSQPHRRAPITSRIPSQLLEARRGSSPAYAAALSQYIGPINPRGHQRLSTNPIPAPIFDQVQMPESYLRRTNAESTQPLSRTRNNNTAGLDHPARAQLPPKQASFSGRIADQTMTDRVQAPSGNFHYTGPISYNPLTEALNPQNASFYPTPMSPNPRKRGKMQSNAAHRSLIQRSDPANQRSSQGDSYMGGMDVSVDLQALGSIAVGSSNAAQGPWGALISKQPETKRRRPIDSRTENTNFNTMQPPPSRSIAPSPPEMNPVPSYAVPVALKKQINTPRPEREATFSLVRNAAVMLDPFTKIVTATVKLVAENGQIWEYKYAGNIRSWRKGQNGKVTVAKLNEWANSILRRRLPGSFPPAVKKRIYSAPPPPKPKADKWTEWERAFLEAHIIEGVQEKMASLDDNDWQLIADVQNEEFYRRERLPRLPMARLTSRTLTIDGVPAIRGGGYTKTEGYFPKRSSSEIQNIIYYWPEIHEKIKEVVRRHRGKIPTFVDCNTDVSDSERTSDDENGDKEPDEADIDALKPISEDL
ncbi:hypothetical protein ACHAO1_002603 [Botrytis cinerea]